jgi:hypothetical protein
VETLLLRTCFFIVLTFFVQSLSVASAQDYVNSIVGTDFDLITGDDPSCFKALTFDRLEKRAEMPDRNRKGLIRPAYVFRSTYSDGTRLSVFVDVRFGDQKSAGDEALRYVKRFGKIPTDLRVGVNRLVIHKTGKRNSASSDDGLIIVYSNNATKRISDNDLEETLFHESVHASWDRKHATSEGWKRAQLADGTFATLYAKRKPVREDLAESALLAFAVIHHPERLPREDLKKIKRSIRNRIMYLETLIPVGKPLIYQIESKPVEVEIEVKVDDVDLSQTGIAIDIISNVMLSHYQLTESEVADCLDHLGEEMIVAAARKMKIDEKEFREVVEKMKYVNSKDGD